MKTSKKFRVPLRVIQTMTILLFTSSCELFNGEVPWSGKDPKKKQITYYGPKVTLGDGNARTFITINKEGVPVSMGITLSEKALLNLPTAHDGHDGPVSLENVLQLPVQAEITPFKFATLDWNPSGHEPIGVFDLPHFDCHFYMISNEERLTIMPLAPDVMDPEIPLAKYLPEIYVQTPGRVPNMGVHWIDPTGHEFNGGTFDRTFIYGTYKEKVAFMEPMVTMDYLKSKPEKVDPILLPEAYQIDGFYPSKYEVKYYPHKKEYQIKLSEFSLKIADQ
ncbi:MAG: DUF5602 domain-containing protein [Anditalea sp.]